MQRAPEDWRKDEIKRLITLWPTHSASQISKELKRSRAAICAKAARLRKIEGVDMTPVGYKHFQVPPDHSTRKKKVPTSGTSTRRKIKPSSAPARLMRPNVESLHVEPCTLHELTERRCHYPIGSFFEKARLFCGAPKPAHGTPYCGLHCKRAFVRRDHH